MMENRAKQPVALMTGATGFIGGHLARRLAAAGWAVHAIQRDDRPASAWGPDPAVTVHIFDSTSQRIVEIVGATRPDLVIHLASLFLAHHTSDDITRLIRSNVELGTQLLEAMTQHRITRLLNTGTSWQHYQDQPFSPACLYAATKEAFECILQFYVECANVRAVTLKLFDTYGPRDRRGKLVELLLRAADTGESLNMSPGEQLIDLVHVNDVVEAFMRAGERLLSDEVAGHEIFSVSGNDRRSLRELAQMVEQVTGRKLNINWGGRPYRQREIMSPWTQGKTLPGWIPQMDLYRGLRELHESRM